MRESYITRQPMPAAVVPDRPPYKLHALRRATRYHRKHYYDLIETAPRGAVRTMMASLERYWWKKAKAAA
jgi:hypothetical protein